MLPPYERDEYSGKVTELLRSEEYRLIKDWYLTEWVDGTPVLMDSRDVPSHKGNDLFAKLEDMFGSLPVTLSGIRYEGMYCAETRLRINDICIDGIWASPVEVERICEKIGLWAPACVQPSATLGEARDIAKQGFQSIVAREDGGAGGPARGVVGRTNPNVFNGSGERLQFKLSMKDF